MDGMQGLIVILGVLLLSGVAALVLAHRTSAPVRMRVPGIAAADADDAHDAERALRRSALQAAVGVLAGCGALAAIVGTGIAVAGGFDQATGYAVPVLAVAAGLAASAAVPQQQPLPRTVSTASLAPRRAQQTVPRSWIVACLALAAAPVAVTALSATLPRFTPVYGGSRLAALLALVAVLLLVARLALRRIALRPALPARLAAADDAIRGAGGRLVLTLTACALLWLTAALALDCGGWAVNVAFVFEGPQRDRVGAFGVALTSIGAAAGVAALATAISAIALTAALHAAAAALRHRAPEAAAA